MSSSDSIEINITKRGGTFQSLDREKLIRRVKNLLTGLDAANVDADAVVDATIRGTLPGLYTTKLDELLAQTAAYLSTRHPDYAVLAGRISVTALYKCTPPTFSGAIEALYNHVSFKTKAAAPLVSERLYNVVMQNKDMLDALIDSSRDLTYDFFGYKTLERSYLISIDKEDGDRSVVERPQYMWLRVALGIHYENLERAVETYNYMSQGYFTHASPTL
eukprot:PhM_4_TR18693/c0_g1_i1/m.98846/K10807/RRM1; ribonucleoside-diphosphate reductase subunit M1